MATLQKHLHQYTIFAPALTSQDEIKEALANGDLDAVKEWLGTKPKLDVPLNEVRAFMGQH